MKANPPNVIPIPLNERCRDLRMRLLPAVIFVLAAGTVALLWRQRVAATALVGQAEPLQVEVRATKTGVLVGLNVTRFQEVGADDAVGQLVITDPRVLASSLNVILAEVELLRADRRPRALQQRLATDYTQLRLDWMTRRAALASARIDLGLAEAELRRSSGLFEKGVEPLDALERAQAARDALQAKVDDLDQLVTEVGQSIQSLPLADGAALVDVAADPLRAAIALQEAKLNLAEEQLSPILLKAPMAGVVSAILRRSGETVMAGDPIMTITAVQPTRIVGYLRQPLPPALRPGMSVAVRTRGWRQQVGTAQVVEVGTQFECIPAILLGARPLAGTEMGLPVAVSLPPELGIRPGELVDLAFADRNPHENP